MTNKKNDFYITKDLFSSYVNYNRPLSYDEWMATSDDCKAAVLYCQFFEQITLCWYKLSSVYSDPADGVAEVLQYLQKNVEVIKQNPKRFTPSYIYKVVYNCLYCLCRDPNKYKQAYENETSNIQVSGDDEFDLFDTYVDERDPYEAASKESRREAFWKLIESDRDTVLVVAELLGEEFDWTDPNPDLPRAGEALQKVKKSHKCKIDQWEYNRIQKRIAVGEVEEFTVVETFEENGIIYRRVTYTSWDEPTFKGVRKFTKKEKESITPEKRAEIIERLKRDLAEFKDLF